MEVRNEHLQGLARIEFRFVHILQRHRVLTYLRLGDRSPRKRTHCPRTLVTSGVSTIHLSSASSSCLTLGPPVDTAFMASHGRQRTATLGRQLEHHRVDFSSSATPASPPVPTLRLRTSERGWKCQRNNTNKPAHVSRLRGKEGRGEGKEESRREGWHPGSATLARIARQHGDAQRTAANECAGYNYG